jgi:formylglycine-generating enzyme required for sulfatase activity
VAVTGVSLNKDTLSLYEGATETLTATVAPANATNKNVTWASSDTATATVNANGIVNGVAAGTATITATTVDGGYTASCAVTVTIPTAADSWTANLKGVNVPFHYVPAGSFQRDDTGGNVSVITRGYWMSETEVTQELFYAVMNAKPSIFTTNPEDGSADGWKKLPVEWVNWSTLAYSDIPTSDNAAWTAAAWDKSKNGYRLPTEMEWMWAAMGADKTTQPNTTGYK